MSAASQDSPSVANHDAAVLETIFKVCFAPSYGTVLVGGGSEPLYIPSQNAPREPHRVIYREDYFASALHEIAHWCIAGIQRRARDDYGYWYAPDGRTPLQQEEFERVEAKPQALEWIFSDACRWHFELSADNLAGGDGPGESFAAAVLEQREKYLSEGVPMRAASFRGALEKHFTR
jgi:hypothetical protein